MTWRQHLYFVPQSEDPNGLELHSLLETKQTWLFPSFESVVSTTSRYLQMLSNNFSDNLLMSRHLNDPFIVKAYLGLFASSYMGMVLLCVVSNMVILRVVMRNYIYVKP